MNMAELDNQNYKIVTIYSYHKEISFPRCTYVWILRGYLNTKEIVVLGEFDTKEQAIQEARKYSVPILSGYDVKLLE